MTKSKKHLTSATITAVVICTVVALNSFVFSAAMEATGGEQEAYTVTAPVLNTTDAVQRDGTDAQETEAAPDINAISKEDAIKIALARIKEAEDEFEMDFSQFAPNVYYQEGSAPANPPLWVISFVDPNLRTINPETAKDSGKPVAYETNIRLGFSVDINALTGKVVRTVVPVKSSDDGTSSEYYYIDFSVDEQTN